MVRKRGPDEAVAVDVQGLLNVLALEFGEDVLMRSAVWMRLRDSKSSFAIEGRRISRIASSVLPVSWRSTPVTALWLSLEHAALAQLQSEILGRRYAAAVRHSPVAGVCG